MHERLLAPCAPLASDSRAQEIASLEIIGLAEFIELTGVRASDQYGTYSIDSTGIRIAPYSNIEKDLGAIEQLEAIRARKLLDLAFPCTPLQFLQWHRNTRGLPHPRDPRGTTSAGVSDFPLSAAFEAAVVNRAAHSNEEEVARDSTTLSSWAQSNRSEPPTTVTSHEIVKAIRVKSDADENEHWWNMRMRNAKHSTLSDSRISRGRGKIPSRWDLPSVAEWLIEAKHMRREQLIQILEERFPDVDIELLR